MSSFFQNFGNQVGQFSQTFGSQVGQLSQNLGNSVNQAIHQGFNTSIQLNEELRVGSHTVLVKEKIAEGGFGLVVLVADMHTQKEMVLKRCNIDREEVFNVVKKEISILQRFTGPYITKMIENDVNFVNNRPDSREALLLLEYYPGGHLLHRLNQRQGSYLPAESIYRIFGQILMGVKVFHEYNPPIINRDLKLENILFGTDGKVRLCDFGSCEESPIHVRNQSEREKVEEAILKETTQMYRAPEMVNLYMRDRLTEKTDIWALGCIFYSLIFLKHPFQDVGSLAILQAKFNIPADSPVSPDAITFLHRMLDIDPEARPSVAELLQQLVEIAAGRALPPYELSAEALKRREERIAADQLRESKNKKKAAPAVPPRKGAPPAANSVAAKRLAAKRGQTIPTSPAANNSTFNDSFEPFNDMGGSSAKSNFSVSTVASGNIANEDFFGDHSPAPTTSQSNANSGWFESDFGDNQVKVRQHHNPPSNAGFDPFADEDDGAVHPKHTTAPTFDAFGSNNANFFDADEDFAPSSNPPSSSVRRPSFEEFSPTTDFHQPATSAAPSSFSGFDEFHNDSDFATPASSQPATTHKGSAAAAVFGTVEDDFAPSNAFAPSSNPTNSDFLFDNGDNDFTDSHGAFGPPSRQNSTNAGRISFTQTSDLTDIDFSLPQAPPSRQSSVAAGGSNPFSAFDSPAPAPAPAFMSHHDPFGSEILTPTVASNAKPAASFGGDLLDTSFASSATPQRKSLNLNNPMDLLSLYDQPKPEPAKPSVMLNNSSAISSIPVIPNNNYHITPGLGGPGGPHAMRVPPPNPFAPPHAFGGIGVAGGAPPMSARPGAPPPHAPFGTAPMYGGAPSGMGMGGGGMYGGGAAPAPGGYGGYSAPVTPSTSFQGNAMIGNNPNAMKPSYGVNSDPFDSLNILKR